jgi:hypothetical protein
MSRLSMLTIAAAMLAAAACRQDAPTSPSTPEVVGEMTVGTASDRDPVTHDPADVVARLELERGGTISFIDLGDGHIGIGELQPAGEEFVSVSMIESQRATPLEVYLALRPAGAHAPDRLVRDHERVAMVRSTPPAPRLLSTHAAGRSPLTNTGHGSYTCEHTGVHWVADWKAAFAGITKYGRRHTPMPTLRPTRSTRARRSTTAPTRTRRPIWAPATATTITSCGWRCTAGSAGSGSGFSRRESRAERSTPFTAPFPPGTAARPTGRAGRRWSITGWGPRGRCHPEGRRRESCRGEVQRLWLTGLTCEAAATANR